MKLFSCKLIITYHTERTGFEENGYENLFAIRLHYKSLLNISHRTIFPKIFPELKFIQQKNKKNMYKDEVSDLLREWFSTKILDTAR